MTKEDKQKKVYKFSEEYPTKDFFEGEKLEVKEILDREITIIDFVTCAGEKGSYIGVNATLDGKQINFSISGIAENQIRIAKTDKRLPIITTIIKKRSKETEKDYYSLS